MIYTIVELDFVVNAFQNTCDTALLDYIWQVYVPLHYLGFISTRHLAAFCTSHHVSKKGILR